MDDSINITKATSCLWTWFPCTTTIKTIIIIIIVIIIVLRKIIAKADHHLDKQATPSPEEVKKKFKANVDDKANEDYDGDNNDDDDDDARDDDEE